MEEIIKLDEVDKYNKFFRTRDAASAGKRGRFVESDAVARAFQDQLLGVCPFPEGYRCGDIMYGRQSYDYQGRDDR